MTLARVYWSEGRSEAENTANASLIAAAPELLESVEAFIECWTAGEFFSNGAVIIAKLRAAVAKAHKCECHESFDCNCREPIPSGVSYREDVDNFYLDNTRAGMGLDFYRKWKLRIAEFPKREPNW
jgi:hypothetical protein